MEALKRLPADAQNKSNCSGPWSLSSFFRNMTKLIHPPPTLFFSEEGRHDRERNRISARIVRVPQLASWNQPALGSNDQAREPAGQLLMRCPSRFAARARPRKSTLARFFFFSFFFCQELSEVKLTKRQRRDGLAGLGEIWRLTIRVMIAASRRLGLCVSVFSSGGEGPRASANRRISLEYKHLQAPDSLSHLRSPALFVPLHGPN